MSLPRTIARTASLAIAVTGALFAVAVGALVQACGGDSETKDGPAGPADAAAEGAAGAAGAAGDGGAEEASTDAQIVIDGPAEAEVLDVVPGDDVTLDVIPAE